jgi:hypothetical protein
MEVDNTTGQETKYKVASGGGSGMAPHHHSGQEAASWSTIAPYSSVQHVPSSSGPWKVYFFVNGESVAGTVTTSDGRVELAETSGKFKVKVHQNGKAGIRAY